MPEETKNSTPATAASPQQTDPIASPPQTASVAAGTNTSGMGSAYPVPAGVAGWGWGPFLMSWIWAIGNNVWIGLLALIPYVGGIMAIVLGVKGREWAWQAKKWESVEAFNETQRKWSIAGLILGTLMIVMMVLLFFLIIVAAVSSPNQNSGPSTTSSYQSSP